ncbi:MAG TPA: ribbon-helix-helix domain-containing protein [Steroidobacteraceae bacterium]
MSAQLVGKQVRVVSYYSPESLEQLKRLCKATRIRQAEHLREALDDLLKKHTATLRKPSRKAD